MLLWFEELQWNRLKKKKKNFLMSIVISCKIEYICHFLPFFLFVCVCINCMYWLYPVKSFISYFKIECICQATESDLEVLFGIVKMPVILIFIKKCYVQNFCFMFFHFDCCAFNFFFFFTMLLTVRINTVLFESRNRI